MLQRDNWKHVWITWFCSHNKVCSKTCRLALYVWDQPENRNYLIKQAVSFAESLRVWTLSTATDKIIIIQNTDTSSWCCLPTAALDVFFRVIKEWGCHNEKVKLTGCYCEHSPKSTKRTNAEPPSLLGPRTKKEKENKKSLAPSGQQKCTTIPKANNKDFCTKTTQVCIVLMLVNMPLTTVTSVSLAAPVICSVIYTVYCQHQKPGISQHRTLIYRPQVLWTFSRTCMCTAKQQQQQKQINNNQQWHCKTMMIEKCDTCQ